MLEVRVVTRILIAWVYARDARQSGRAHEPSL